MISKDLEAQILRLHHAEHWPVGTIAVQLGVHPDAVERVIAQEGLPRACPVRPSMLEPYLPFIEETLRRWPTLRASRLYDMCVARGYRGGPTHFRHRIRGLRPRRSAEAYLRLATLPGEQAQVDWGHFGQIAIGRARRALMGFVMVLSWSRAIYLRFFLGALSVLTKIDGPRIALIEGRSPEGEGPAVAGGSGRRRGSDTPAPPS